MKSPTLQHVCDMAFVLADKVREDLRRRPSDTPGKTGDGVLVCKGGKEFALPRCCYGIKDIGRTLP